MHVYFFWLHLNDTKVRAKLYITSQFSKFSFNQLENKDVGLHFQISLQKEQ